MKSHGPWKIKQTNEVFRDDYVRLWVDEVVRPDGQDGQHVVVSIKNGICVLAIDDKNNLHLTKEFHYAVGRNSIEAVSGGIEAGENPDETARRELQEELGLRASDWNYVTTVDPFTTILLSPTRIYFARGLSEVKSSPEGTEQIEKIVISLEEAVARILSGEISHAPTCVAILLAQSQLRESSA